MTINLLTSKILTLAKRLLIIFLTVIVLGFVFNQSIAHYFVPKVSYTVPEKDQPLLTMLTISGVIKPKKVVPISFDKDVFIDKLYYPVGSVVLAGEPFFKLAVAPEGKTDSGKEIQNLSQQSVINRLNTQKNTLAKELGSLKTKLNALEDDYHTMLALYKEGAVSKSRLDNALQAKQALEASLSTTRLSYQGIINDLSIARQKLAVLNGDVQSDVFHYVYSPDAEGICYAQTKGVLMSLERRYELIKKNQVVGLFAEVKDADDLYFEMLLDIKKARKLRLREEVTLIDTKNDQEYRIKITGINQVAVDNKVKVVADFIESDNLPLINLTLSGEIVDRSEDYAYIIPKYTLLSRANIEKDTENYVYLIEESSGILGTEYHLRKTLVTIIAVGDDHVAIMPLDDGNEELPKIVANLGHNLADFQRVMLMVE